MNMFCCPLCVANFDSHEHLFFKCSYSTQVWQYVRSKAGLSSTSVVWEDIVNEFFSFAKKNSIKSVVAKLILASAVYCIWQERNARLFKKVKKPAKEVIDLILSTVRLKLVTCKYRKTRRVEQFLTAWDLPFSLILHA